jgi:hypothetical protein
MRFSAKPVPSPGSEKYETVHERSCGRHVIHLVRQRQNLLGRHIVSWDKGSFTRPVPAHRRGFQPAPHKHRTKRRKRIDEIATPLVVALWRVTEQPQRILWRFLDPTEGQSRRQRAENRRERQTIGGAGRELTRHLTKRGGYPSFLRGGVRGSALSASAANRGPVRTVMGPQPPAAETSTGRGNGGATDLQN